MFDLKYNSNLPDALNIHALTPYDALSKSLLQEQDIRAMHRTGVDAQRLHRFLQECAFETVERNLEALGAFREMSLEDVETARATDQWREYISAVRGLIRSPTKFNDGGIGARAVYSKYITLIDKVTKHLAQRRKDDFKKRWEPRLGIVMQLAGATLDITLGSGVAGFAAAHLTRKVTSKAVAGAGAVISVKLSIGSWKTQTNLPQLGANFELVNEPLESAKEQWDYLVARLREQLGSSFVDYTERYDELAALNSPDPL